MDLKEMMDELRVRAERIVALTKNTDVAGTPAVRTMLKVALDDLHAAEQRLERVQIITKRLACADGS